MIELGSGDLEVALAEALDLVVSGPGGEPAGPGVHDAGRPVGFFTVGPLEMDGPVARGQPEAVVPGGLQGFAAAGGHAEDVIVEGHPVGPLLDRQTDGAVDA